MAGCWSEWGPGGDLQPLFIYLAALAALAAAREIFVASCGLSGCGKGALWFCDMGS